MLVSFHGNLLCFDRKVRNGVNNHKDGHEEDEQEPVGAEGRESPAADPLRPEPRRCLTLRGSIRESTSFRQPRRKSNGWLVTLARARTWEACEFSALAPA